MFGSRRKRFFILDFDSHLEKGSSVVSKFSAECFTKDARGSLIGIEVKSAASVTKKDFSGAGYPRRRNWQKFIRGVVLYTGDTAVAFGDNLIALPISALWRMT